MRGVIKTVVNTAWAAWFWALGSLPRRRGSRSTSIVLAAPGQGNVGDQAMLESFLFHTSGEVQVIARRAADIVIPDRFVDRTEVVELPAVLYRYGISVFRDSVRFRRMLRGASQFAVIGADIMDGAHNSGASMRRFELASLAARQGVESRVLGFSWNANPVPIALRALRRVHKGVLLIPRDPVSSARLRASGARNVVDGSDLVFLHPVHEEESEILGWARKQTAAGRRVVLVNLNSLVEKRVPQIGTMARICQSLIAKGISIAVVPHDPRNWPSDLDLAEVLVEKVGDPNLVAAPLGLSPSQIASLARVASGTVSARMHLTILSLAVGTPTIGISYQGKVEGLYELLELPQLCVDPSVDFERALTVAVELLVGEPDRLVATVNEHLPRLKQLSQRNFDGRGR